MAESDLRTSDDYLLTFYDPVASICLIVKLFKESLTENRRKICWKNVHARDLSLTSEFRSGIRAATGVCHSYKSSRSDENCFKSE